MKARHGLWVPAPIGFFVNRHHPLYRRERVVLEVLWTTYHMPQ